MCIGFIHLRLVIGRLPNSDEEVVVVSGGRRSGSQPQVARWIIIKRNLLWLAVDACVQLVLLPRRISAFCYFGCRTELICLWDVMMLKWWWWDSAFAPRSLTRGIWLPWNGNIHNVRRENMKNARSWLAAERCAGREPEIFILKKNLLSPLVAAILIWRLKAIEIMLRIIWKKNVSVSWPLVPSLASPADDGPQVREICRCK